MSRLVLLALLLPGIASAERTLTLLSDPTLGRADAKYRLTVSNEPGVIITDDVEELVVLNSPMAKVTGSARTVMVKDSPGIGFQGFRGKTTERAEKQIDLFNSPNAWVADSFLNGPTFAIRSRGFRFVRNEVEISHSSLEGVEVRGPGDVLVAENRITGSYESSNDLIEISTEVSPKRMDAFRWPYRDRLIFDSDRPAWDEQPGWRYVRATFLAGPHIGKSLTYGEPVSQWAENVVVRDNVLVGARIAGLFLYCVKNFKVSGNQVKNTSDYGLGAEWCVDGVFEGNKITQDRDKQIRTGGGMAVMQSIDNVTIRNNDLDGCNIYIRPWGFPITNVVVQGNKLTTPTDSSRGKIWVMYEGVLWAKNIHIRDNVLFGGWIDVNSSPFYTTGSITGNLVDRRGHNDNRFGITVESFDGEISGNRIFGARFPVRDFNVGGERLTSKVIESNNLANGQGTQITVADKIKPPVEVIP